MLFNIESDEGSRIVGYLIPDSFSGSSAVRITDGQRELLILQCHEERVGVAASGRHATGRIGFSIDETIIPSLAQLEMLEVYDEATNILIYRRRPPSQVIQKRIFRLETHLFPLWRLDDSLDRHFQHFHKGIERHGRETSIQVFLLNNSSSLYLSGRLIFKTYENYVDETFNCIVLLRDPYMDLAEKLLTLKHVRAAGKKILGERDLMAYGPAIAFAEVIENDEKALRRAFATMPKAAISNLANPVIRLLAARTPEEVPGKGAIATALGALSRFSIVGLRERQDLFLAQVADLLGINKQALPVISEFSKTDQLCEQLRLVPEVGVLIEQDLEVYYHVKSAIEGAFE